MARKLKRKASEARFPASKIGIVAILDALGAAVYSDREIREFLRSREAVIDALNDKSEQLGAKLDVSQITTYTFNDTVLIILECQGAWPTQDEIKAFATMLRKMLVDSLERRIMFRGSVAIGQFYEESGTNTILGHAVTDAASWYDKTEWIGVVATPQASTYIDHLVEQDRSGWGHLLVKYDVPIKGGQTRRLWALNWPKVFWVPSLSPCDDEYPREAFLKFLSRFGMPIGTEHKHFNTVKFFDAVTSELALPAKKKITGKSRT